MTIFARWLCLLSALPVLLLAPSADAALTLTWEDASGGVAGVEVARKTSTLTWVTIATVPPGVTTYVDADAVLYPQCYRVRAVDPVSGMVSPYSDEACGGVPTVLPLTLSGAGAGSGSVTLTAKPASGSTFVGWAGACSGTGACTVVGNAPVQVTAQFAASPAPPPGGADLVVAELYNPPLTMKVGVAFVARDGVKNQGTANAAPSVTRFYLSQDPARDPTDVLLSGSRRIVGLQPGQMEKGAVYVRVPAGTPPGLYYLLACVDDLSQVGEADEGNNCSASVAKGQVVP